MPLEIVTIPCRSDNYAFLVKPPGSAPAILVDAPEAGPIREALESRGWTLGAILITHHHMDHVEAVPELREAYGAKVVGPKAEEGKLPALDLAVVEGDDAGMGLVEAQVLEVPGHTLGHIAFFVPDAGAVFTADSLMAMGCGRLFEGTAAQMWSSLSKLSALPDATLVCSGHEYTEANARFAVTVDPENPALQSRIAEIAKARAGGIPTVPSRLDLEKATNPFLRAATPELKAYIGMSGATDSEAFAKVRRMKDAF